MVWKEQKNANFHSRNTEIGNEEFQKRMRALKNEDYLAALYEFRKGLNFTGEMSNIEMEILLIRTAEMNFPKDTSLKTSIKRDIFLMSVGLLKGYRQCRNKEDRRLKFLQESDYIAVYNKGEYASCNEDEISEATIDNMLQALIKAEDRAINFIADKLYKEDDCNKYSESLSDYYEYEPNRLKYEKSIPDSELLPLRHHRNSIYKKIKPPVVITKEQGDQEQKINDSNPSEKSKGSKKTGKKKKHSKGGGGDTTYDNSLGGKSINLTVPIVFIINSGNKILKAVKVNNVRITKVFCFLCCIVSVFNVYVWLTHSTEKHNENIVGQVYLSQSINKDEGIHLKPGDVENYTVTIGPLETDAGSAKIEIENSNVARLVLDSFPPPTPNQRNMTIYAQVEWDERNHDTKITIRGENINKEDIPVIVDKPDASIKENVDGVFNAYEGDEGDRQLDHPMD